MKKKKLTSSEVDGVQYRSVSTGQIILAQLTYLPLVLMGVLLTYVSYLQSAGYGIATAVAGIILTAFTLYDGVIDPFIAKFVDNFNTKFGKIRILLLVGFAIAASSIYILYCVTSNGKFGLLTYILINMIFYAGYSVYCIAQATIAPILTNDPMQRPKINLWATLIGIFPPIIFMVLVSVFMLPKYGNEYTVPMLGEMCLWVVGIGFIALLLGILSLKNVDKPEVYANMSVQQERVSFKDMAKMFKENKALQAYFWAAASDRLATTMSGQAVVTTLLAGILMKDMASNSTMSMIPMVVGMIALFPIAKKNGKLGSKKGMVYWTVLGLAISVAQFVFYYVLMINGTMDQMFSNTLYLLIFCIAGSLRNIFVNGNGNATSMMMSDVIDYQCYLTGKYMPAAVTATYGFLEVFINSFGSTLALSLLTLVGYVNTMPQPTDEATMPIFWITMFIHLGVPAIGWIINLFAMKRNPLTREKMIEVQKVIAETKAASQEEC